MDIIGVWLVVCRGFNAVWLHSPIEDVAIGILAYILEKKGITLEFDGLPFAQGARAAESLQVGSLALYLARVRGA